MSNIPPTPSSFPAAQRMRHGSKDRCVQARVTAFLRKSLAKAAQDVLTLETMARTEGLLGERQRITDAWPAPGSEDTELGVLMEPEVGHGETEVYPRVQA